MNFTLLAVLLCFALFAIFVVLRIVGPWAQRFAATASGLDSLQHRVFPMLGFLCLMAVLAKITLF